MANDAQQHLAGAGIRSLIDRWQQDQEFRESIAFWQVTAAHDATSAPLPPSLDPRLHSALHSLGINQLYSHQAEAFHQAQEGENLVISTGTASGKTLCYNLPAAQLALSNANARILYLFPTKALAQDQLNSLNSLLKAIPTQKPLTANIFDGDTPQNMRSAMRKQSVFLLTNPDMLHQGILPHHAIWQSFFQGLNLVVIDEMHTYRGIFGSHFANLLRRLKRVAAFYGAFPKFILTSATIANPVDLAEILIDEKVHLIDQNGAPQGEKHFLLYNPPFIDKKLGLRKSSVQTSVNVGLSLLETNHQALLFARTRRTVEMLLTFLLEKLPIQTRQKVRGYRSGYLKSDRREIEQGFKDGSVRLVVATSALELGIDIGELESVVLVGYPGSIATTLQRAGRAGRKQQDSLALMVATNDAMDQYLANHPEYLSNSPEKALVDPNNLLVLYQHLRCATFELPFARDEGFGPIDSSQLGEIFSAMNASGEVLSRNNTHFWVADAYPSAGVSLRSSTADLVSLYVDDTEKPRLLGQIDAHSAEWLVHPRAVYLHAAESYLVDDLDLEKGVCKLQPARLDYYTLPTISTTIEDYQERNNQPVGTSSISSGPLSLSIRVEGYRKIRWQTNETLERLPLELPARKLETEGTWFSISETLVDSLKNLALWNSDPNDYGPGWNALRQKVLVRDQHTCAACHQTFSPGDLHVHHIQPFKTFADPILANAPSNLVTLCHRCHTIVETRVRVISGMAGARHALRNIAPLMIMCDDADIGMISEPKSILNNGQPAILVYDTIPGGVGLSNQLFLDHLFWLGRAIEMIADCPCQDGCPACVGPFGEDGYGSKRESLALLKGLLDERLE